MLEEILDTARVLSWESSRRGNGRVGRELVESDAGRYGSFVLDGNFKHIH